MNCFIYLIGLSIAIISCGAMDFGFKDQGAQVARNRANSEANYFSIGNIPANKYMTNLINEQYPCLSYIRSQLRPLAKKKYSATRDNARAQEDDEARIRLSIESEQTLIACLPFYDKLVEHGLRQLDSVNAEAIRLWMKAVQRYLLATGIEGYANIILNNNIRQDTGQLMGFFRETMHQKNPDLIRSDADFGFLGPDKNNLEGDIAQHNIEKGVQMQLMRAYHAGEGFCVHLRSAPLSHLAYLVRNLFWIDNHLRVYNCHSQRHYTLERVLEFLDGHPIMAKIDDDDEFNKINHKLPAVTLLHALDLICKSFEKNPSEALLDHATANMKTAGLGSMRNVIIDLSKARIQRYTVQDGAQQDSHVAVIKRMANYFSDKESCSWVQFFRLKRFSAFWLELGEEYEFTRNRMELALNIFLERCTTKLLLEHYRSSELISLWPKFPDNVLARNLATRLQNLPLRDCRCDRLVQLLDTRSFGWIEDFEESWLIDEKDLFTTDYRAGEGLVKSYANGSDLCQFYTRLPIFSPETIHLKKMTELMYSMFDITGFKPNHTNDGISFFYLWRLCSLNAILPIDMRKANLRIS